MHGDSIKHSLVVVNSKLRKMPSNVDGWGMISEMICGWMHRPSSTLYVIDFPLVLLIGILAQSSIIYIYIYIYIYIHILHILLFIVHVPVTISIMMVMMMMMLLLLMMMMMMMMMMTMMMVMMKMMMIFTTSCDPVGWDRVHLGAYITRSNTIWYCKQHCSDWGKIYMWTIQMYS